MTALLLTDVEFCSSAATVHPTARMSRYLIVCWASCFHSYRLLSPGLKYAQSLHHLSATWLKLILMILHDCLHVLHY